MAVRAGSGASSRVVGLVTFSSLVGGAVSRVVDAVMLSLPLGGGGSPSPLHK